MAIRNLPGALYALRIETGISGLYEKRIAGRPWPGGIDG
jgi:hypothetical protein